MILYDKTELNQLILYDKTELNRVELMCYTNAIQASPFKLKSAYSVYNHTLRERYKLFYLSVYIHDLRSFQSLPCYENGSSRAD